MTFKLSKPSFSVPENIDLKSPHILLASWFGCGFISPAPGTWGSLGAIPFALIISFFGGTSALLFFTILIITIGLWAAQKFDEATGEEDSKMIVIDEVAGQWIALLPAGFNPILIILAFLAFRGFDIFKPFPVNTFDQNIKGSAGVMGDDLVAGFMAFLCVWLLGYFMI